MVKKRCKNKKILISSICILLALLLLCFSSLFKVKPLLFTYAKSTAETILLNAANQSVINIFNANNITYNKLSNITRDAENNVTGIEIDTKQINLIKSNVSNEISALVSKEEYYDLYIPIGSLLGNEYTTGFGPKLKFRMQLTQTAFLDFNSMFFDAGINQTLHQIIIKIKINANILMIGFTSGFSVATDIIAAQTVIIGRVPDSITNVEEHPGDDIADEIFNYADVD